MKLTLEVDNHGEDNDGGDQVHAVGQVLPAESLAKSKLLVGPGDEKVDKADNGTLELGTTASVDSGRGEGAPDDRLANVGGDEERDARPETVTFLEELVEEDDDERGRAELDDQEETDTSAEVAGLTVHASEDVDGRLAERQDEGKH